MLSGKKRTLEKMSHGIFAGVSVMFHGLPAVRVKVFSNIILTNGGNVIKTEKKTNALQYSKMNILDPNLNYIIVDKPLSMLDLCSKLHCESIPKSVQVLKCTWLEQCASRKSLLDSDGFSAIVCPANEEIEHKVDTTTTKSAREGSSCGGKSADIDITNNSSYEVSSHKIGGKKSSKSPPACAGIILRHLDRIFMVQVSE